MSTPISSSAPKSSGIFYGWWIAAISTVALLISNGLTIGGLPVFYKYIQEDLVRLGTVTVDKKDAMTGLAAGLTFLLAGIFSLVVGLLLKKIKLKIVMIAGCLVLGSALMLYSFATTPLHIYLSHSLFGLALGLVGVMIQTVLISNWFRRLRGTAMGIVLVGTSLGGAIIPRIATPLIEEYGWRAAIQTMSLLVWFVLLPGVILFVRDRASDFGLNFDGDKSSSDFGLRNADLKGEANSNREKSDLAIAEINNPETNQSEIRNSKSEIGVSLGEAVKTPTFWLLALCAALIFYPIFTISQQFNLYLQNTVKVSAETASIAQSILFVTSVAGKFLFGWLCDRFPTRVVIMICCGIMFLATLMLLGFLNAGTIYVFLIPFGLGYGGTFVLIQLLAVESFGLRDVGKILGLLTLIETFGGFVGSVITGRLASAANGDYTLAFYGVTVAAGLAFLMTFAINVFKPKKVLA